MYKGKIKIKKNDIYFYLNAVLWNYVIKVQNVEKTISKNS